MPIDIPVPPGTMRVLPEPEEAFDPRWAEGSSPPLPRSPRPAGPTCDGPPCTCGARDAPPFEVSAERVFEAHGELLERLSTAPRRP